MIGRAPLGCAARGWPEMSKADAVMNAIARDAGIAKRDAGIAEREAGIARPALLGLSRPNIRNPVFAAGLQASGARRKLGSRAAGVNARPITLCGSVVESKACRLRHQRGGITACVHWRSSRSHDARQ